MLYGIKSKIDVLMDSYNNEGNVIDAIILRG